MDDPDSAGSPSPWRPRAKPASAPPAESPWRPRRQGPAPADVAGHAEPAADADLDALPPAQDLEPAVESPAPPVRYELAPDPYATPRAQYPEPADPYPGTPDPGSTRSRRRTPVIAAAVVLGLLLFSVVVFVGLRVIDRPGTAAGAPAATASDQPLDSDGAVPSADATAAAEPTPSATLPASPPAIIDYSAVANDPLGPSAALVVGDYLQAVNDGRYDDAYRAYTQAWQAANPFASWEQAVESSQHRSAVMTAVEQAVDGSVSANVSFESTQAAGLGPAPRPQETCTQWSLVYHLVPDNSSYYPLSIDGSKPIANSVPCP